MRISTIYDILERDRHIKLTAGDHTIKFAENGDEWTFTVDGEQICFAPDLASAMDCLEQEFDVDELERMNE